MAKTVWIINQYASTPDTGIGGRHFELGKALANQGYDVYLVLASFHHLLHTPRHTGKSRYSIVKDQRLNIVRVGVPKYDDAHNGRRILNWFIFAFRLSGLKKIIPQKPDVILYSSLSPIGVLKAEKLSRYYNVPLIFEVRDLWPLTLTELGEVSKRHPFVVFLQWIEDRAYRCATRVISNLPGAIDHMSGRGLNPEKFTWIPNGISGKAMDFPEPLDPGVQKLIPSSGFVVGYSGTIGLANAIDCLLTAANLLKNESDVQFVLVGSGKEKKRLMERVKTESLSNVHFLPAIAKAQVPSLLDHFDACFIGWQDEPMYRFGVGANKIPEYLYSGKPIIHAFSGKYDPVALYDAGITVPAEKPQALADAILELYRLPEARRAEMGANGKQAAVKDYDYANLAERLENVLFGARVG